MKKIDGKMSIIVDVDNDQDDNIIMEMMILMMIKLSMLKTKQG